jgi:hypothetical protein
LFEITSVLFVDKHQIKVVSCAKFLVHVPERGCQVETT